MSFFRESPSRVIGHRGSPRKARENTLPSFDWAEADGADGFELDVRLTADGEAVVHHDSELLWKSRRVPLASLTWAELREGTTDDAPPIPALREVFERYGASVGYLVELKAGPSPRAGLLEFRVAALLTQFHLLAKSCVLSFSAEMLRRIKEVQPQIDTCLNFDALAYRPPNQLWPDLPRGCAAIGPNLALASEALFQKARDAGLSVHVWTVNDVETARRLALLGAASVITDVPGEIAPALQGVAREA